MAIIIIVSSFFYFSWNKYEYKKKGMVGTSDACTSVLFFLAFFNKLMNTSFFLVVKIRLYDWIKKKNHSMTISIKDYTPHIFATYVYSFVKANAIY